MAPDTAGAPTLQSSALDLDKSSSCATPPAMNRTGQRTASSARSAKKMQSSTPPRPPARGQETKILGCSPAAQAAVAVEEPARGGTVLEVRLQVHRGLPMTNRKLQIAATRSPSTIARLLRS